ncbi:MAG TPA: hypothetical protein VGV87_21900 [Blastocatellia bacterium]|nr:hypothetical protein [Blastocatellia bacterium]
MTAEVNAENTRSGSPPAAPVEGAVDWQQLRAIVRLGLWQSFRSALKPGTGKRAHLLRQLIISMGFVGLFFSIGARRCDDLPTYLTLLFSVAFGIVALSVLPDTLDGRRRNVEVLSSKPIASTTLLAARAVNISIVSALITGSFAVAPMISATWVFNCSWILVAGLFLLLNLGSFAVVVLSVTTFVLAARWFNLDRLRTFAQFLLVSVNLGMMGMSLLSMSEMAIGSESTRFSFSSLPWIKLLPSVWFADFLVSDLGARANLERAGALLVLASALLIAVRLDLGRRYPDLLDRLLESDEQPTSRPLAVLLLETASRLPLIGKWLAPAQPLAVATLILTLTQRELISRLKILVPRVILIAFFVVALSAGDRYFSPLIVAFYGFIGLLTGCDLIKQSSQPAASWPLLAAPIDALQIIRGMRLVVTVKYFALPAVLVTFALFLINPPILAGLLALCYFVETRCLISLLILMSPALPLSAEHVTTAQFVGLGVSMVATLVTTIGYVTVTGAYGLFGYIGLGLGVIGLVMLVFASYWLDRGAAARLQKLEYEH